MQELPAEAFPSDGLREFMLYELRQNNDSNVVSIHRKYYSQLLKCTTLDEAKEIYPEFKGVIDARDLDFSNGSIFNRIKNGKFGELKIENLSLYLLQKYYAELVPDSNQGVKKALNMSHSTFHTMLDTLNIRRDKRYSKLLGLRMQGDKLKNTAQTQEYKEKHSAGLKAAYANNPDLIKIRREKQKQNWKNPEYVEKTLTSQAKTMQSAEYRQKRQELAIAQWQDKDYKKLMDIVAYSAQLAWELHPDAKQLYKDMAKEFPDLSKAINKIRRKELLTEREREINLLYYKACNEKFPHLKKEIAEIQKSPLAQWGFYDKDRDIEKIIMTIDGLKNPKN